MKNKEICKLVSKIRKLYVEKESPLNEISFKISEFTDLARSLRKSILTYNKASVKNWRSSQNRYFHNFINPKIRKLSNTLNRITHVETTTSKKPSFRNLFTEIKSLETGGIFKEVQIKKENKQYTLSAVTEPVELEGYRLGRFRIVWNINNDIYSLSNFRAIALEPSPAAGNPDVTHPHVSGDHICFGGRGEDLASLAIEDGRIEDVFKVINSILHTYNSSSPHVPLDEWDSQCCSSCGESCEDEIRCRECGFIACPECVPYCCDGCDRELCPECVCNCSDCGSTICGNCSSYCENCNETTCSSCSKICDKCDASLCCASECNSCNKTICNECQEMKECTFCESNVCSECMTRCSNCGHTKMCIDCDSNHECCALIGETNAS